MAVKQEDFDHLLAQMEAMQQLLKLHGIEPARAFEPGANPPDYIAHGSPEHATFLGLVPVTEEEGDLALLATYTSPRTGATYRLEDEMAAVQMYHQIDPDKAVRLVLQQRVGELESAPQVPADAPPMFRSAPAYP